MRGRPPLTQRTPHLGLVCITVGPEVRYRTITRTRYLALPTNQRAEVLRALYESNYATLLKALAFCHARDIRLYRVTSGLFPMSDDALGEQVLREMSRRLGSCARKAARLGIRVLAHPDQYVVLNSVSPDVAQQSRDILAKHALTFDLLGLPRSTWSPLIVHGGKSGRALELVQAIAQLPENVRLRLVLENDERAYSAAEILEICRAAGVPMVFDAHHHVIHENLDSYDHPSVTEFTALSRETWPQPDWQIVHISNGAEAFNDPRHSVLITQFPSAFQAVPWVEVEAKGKEQAIDALRELLNPGLE